MYTLPVILFSCGVVLGGIHGYFMGQTALDMLFSIAVGGFLGSALGGAAFMYVYLYHQDPEDNEILPAGKSLEALPRRPLVPRPLQDLSQGQAARPPEPRPEAIPAPDPFPPDNTAAESRARQIQNLEKEINALKNKQKGN